MEQDISCLLIAAVMLFSAARCQSQNGSDTDILYVKNAAPIAITILSADSLLLHLADGRAARLTVLDSLVTDNGAIVARLVQMFPGIGMRKGGAASSVSFHGIEFPHAVASEGRVLSQFSSFVSYFRQYHVPFVEMQITCQLTDLPWLAFQLGAATNLSDESDKLIVGWGSDPSYAHDHEPFIVRHAFVGIGASNAIGLLRWNLFINAGERRIFRNGPESVTDMSLFVSPSVEADLFDSHFRLSIGGHIFLNQPPAAGSLPSSPGTFNIGAGYRL